MLWKAIFMCQFYGLVLRGNLVSWKESFLKYSRTVINWSGLTVKSLTCIWSYKRWIASSSPEQQHFLANRLGGLHLGLLLILVRVHFAEEWIKECFSIPTIWSVFCHPMANWGLGSVSLPTEKGNWKVYTSYLDNIVLRTVCLAGQFILQFCPWLCNWTAAKGTGSSTRNGRRHG